MSFLRIVWNSIKAYYYIYKVDYYRLYHIIICMYRVRNIN